LVAKLIQPYGLFHADKVLEPGRKTAFRSGPSGQESHDALGGLPADDKETLVKGEDSNGNTGSIGVQG
jgi:hypothetical protein